MTSWTLTTSGAAIIKAGKYINSVIKLDEANLALWSDQAEATLKVMTRKDWVADYASVDANSKAILSNVVSSMIAKRIIGYDMSGYPSLNEATSMVDILHDEIKAGIEVLRNQEYQEKM